jgi:hypothetical protein
MPRHLVLLTLGLLIGASSTAQAQDVHHFTSSPVQVGEESTEQYRFQLDLEMTIKKDGFVVDTFPQKLDRRQQRQTTVLAVVDGSPRQARVVYRQSADVLTDRFETHPAEPRSVAGKTYLVARKGDELIFTDGQGQPVSEEEQTILAADLASFGKPNPIAQFFNGQKLAVGARLKLPPKLVEKLLSMGGKPGDGSACEMTFVGVQQADGATCAVLDTTIRAQAEQGGAMNMVVKGRLLLEISTCRAVALDFGGPVQMEEDRGQGAGKFKLDSKGTIKIAIDSQHRLR